MLVSPEDYSALIESIYQAGEGLRPWTDPLEGIAGALQARDTNLIFIDRGTPLVCAHVRGDPAMRAAYNGHWNRHDPWVHSGHPLIHAEATVVLGAQVIADEVLRKTAFYQEFLKPAGLGQLLGLGVLRRKGLMAAVVCLYPESAGPPTPEQIALARSLLPHLRRGLTLHRRLIAAGGIAQADVEALERTAAAMVLLDHEGRIRHANRRAEHILQQNDGLRVEDGRLRAQRAAEDERLHSTVHACVRRHGRKGWCPGGLVRVPRPSGRLDYVLEVLPLSDEGRPPGGLPLAALVVVADPATAPCADERRLSEAFDLTPMESKVAAAVLRGLGPEDIAAELGIAPSTVHTHLKNLHRKLGVSSRTELMRALMAASPVICPPGSRPPD